MGFLKETYEDLVGQTFSYRFLDDRVDALYRADERAGKLLLVFGGLSLLVACLGLLGLAAFAAELRTREIGIRKVLGATMGPAGPAPLEGVRSSRVRRMAQWLDTFSYRIDVGPAFFAMATAWHLSWRSRPSAPRQ